MAHDRPASLTWTLLLGGLFLAGFAGAAPFGEPGPLDGSIPTPESVLGAPLGEQFTPHHRLVAYLETLDAASDRISLESYGTTTEGRPLLLLVVSTPENLARREAIRSSYARIADPRHISRDEVRALARNLPVGVWLSFNIHGDEASSSEAAMGLAYRLAADASEEMQTLLEQSVVLIDPCLNPDGRDRYVNWVRGVMGSRPDPAPQSREHDQPWPGGRYNHYLFDMNRDWAWLVQSESRDRARAYLSWRPQVHVDFHEMWAEATYFFFPPEHPIHTLYPPQVEAWAARFGRGNAAAFDAKGWRYYTGESFDLFYPGYGDTWPTFHGAIGMTYEQAGHGQAGVAFRRSDGDTLTLAERAHHHYTAALATIRTAAANREARLLDFHEFFRPSGDRHAPAAYYLPPGPDAPRTAELIDLLMTHGAEIYRTRTAGRPRGLHDYEGNPVARSLPADTYVIPLDQPLHRFLRGVLEPEAAVPDTFFYDVSAWSLPLAFGVEAYWSREDAGSDLERLKEPPQVEGGLIHGEAGYAYLIPWEPNNAVRLASWLQEHHVRLSYAEREFRAAGRTFGPGSLIAFAAGNPPGLGVLLDEGAERTGVNVYGVSTGLTDEGPDLGSAHVRALPTPKVAVLADDPASPTSVGACWFLLDRLFPIPHSLFTLGELSAESLRSYSVLVFPDDGAGGRGYQARVDSSTVEEIRTWIREGGVFVGLGGGAFFASADGAGLSSVTRAEEEKEEFPSEEARTEDEQRRRETLSEREYRERLDWVPGTIFSVKVDPMHPLGFGYTDEARVLKISDAAFDLGPEGTNVAWFTDTPRVSGYAPDTAIETLAGSPFLVDEPVGRGHVVLFVEDPNFRLFWYGMTKMFLNSLFFLGGPTG